ncbi:PLP-dependent aminotransferase family protein [Erythrobacter sp. HA6-11]
MNKPSRSALNPCTTLALDPKSSTPAYAQLASQLRAKIFDGQIIKGERLPATRQLANMLGVSRRTIVTVYEVLCSEGLIETYRGDGTYCVFDETISVRTNRPSSPSISRPTWLGPDQTQIRLDKAYAVLPLSPRGIDPGALSLKAWSTAAARAQKTLSAGHFFGSVPGGLPRLKEALVKHLLALRGLNVDPSQVIVTAGIRESIDLATELLPGLQRVGLEEPSNKRIRNLMVKPALHAPHFVPLAVDENGANFDALTRNNPVNAVLVTPSHQYPMGITLSSKRRHDLVENLKGTDTWVFEDDYGCALRFSGANIQPIFQLDTRNRTLYFGTISSIVFSNLHLSFLVVPKEIVSAVIRIQERKGSLASILAQAALAEFMECGAFAQHLLNLRRCGHANYKALFDEVQEKLSDWLTPVAIDGGMSFVALARDPKFDDKAMALAAKAQGISPTPLSQLYLDQANAQPGLVFGFMGTSPQESRSSVDRLRTILQAELG